MAPGRSAARTTEDMQKKLDSVRRQHIKRAMDMTLSCSEDESVHEFLTDAQRAELYATMEEYGKLDRELEHRAAVMGEITNKLTRKDDIPELESFAKHRLEALQDSAAGQVHPRVQQFKAKMDAATGGLASGTSFLPDDDEDLQMTQADDRTPTEDRFSRQKLTAAYRSPACPSFCVFNKSTVDTIFQKASSVKCPCCDQTLIKTNMMNDKRLLRKIQQVQAEEEDTSSQVKRGTMLA